MYYVQFNLNAIPGNDPANTLPLNPTLPAGGSYIGHYGWTVAKITDTSQANTPTSWLRFTPATTGPIRNAVSGTPPQNFYMVAGQAAGNPSWEIFKFNVTNYIPQWKWYWLAHVGTVWNLFGPLDMSNCWCDNCDAGFSQRIISNCNLGYESASGVYADASTNLSKSGFNENECLYAFELTNNRLQMFYTDEHALCIGISSVTIGTSGPTTTYSLPPSPASPMCISGNPTLNFGNAIWSGHDPQANIDGNGVSNGCIESTGQLTCGRPLPPALFLTDLTTNGPTSRIGDWQYGGTPVMPTQLCGTWKGATKTGVTLVPSTNTYTFTLNVANNPAVNVVGRNWNLGAGSDPVPIWDQNGAVLPAPEGYGAEAIWDLSLLSLTPSHSYRLQFMVHDGDQHRTGGDIGQACIQLEAQCDPGLSGTNCDQCDLKPLPSNGLYIWYCFIAGSPKAQQPYTLRKIPLSQKDQPPYLNNGFQPGATQFDAQGYAISCNCQRTIVPCPMSCCGNGVCLDNNGTCVCQGGFKGADCCTPPVPPPNPPPNTTPTPTPIPCLNDGHFCSGNGVCENGACNCTLVEDDGTTYTGPACNISVPPPPPPALTCPGLNASDCSTCITLASAYAVGCEWCPNIYANVTEVLTNGTCATIGQCGNGAQSVCVPPVIYVPPPCPDECSGHGSCVNVTDDSGNTTRQKCVCFDGFSGINCGIGQDITAIVAGTVGAAAIAGIVLGIVAFCGIAGGGTYAYVKQMDSGDSANISNNPLYADARRGGENPMHKPD